MGALHSDGGPGGGRGALGVGAMTETMTTSDLVQYGITAEDIAATRRKYEGLTADSPGGYELVRRAISEIRTTRVAIEERRVALKSDALAYGRLVDVKAKELTGMLLSIEEPLKAKKALIDDEKERRRAEAEAERVRLFEEAQRQKRAAEEALAQAERETKEAKLREAEAEAEAERARLDEERKALAVEREALRAEREAAERAQLERDARIKAEEAATEKAAQMLIQAEERRLANIERAAATQRRLDAIRPDAEKLARYAAALGAVPVPEMSTEEGQAHLLFALDGLHAFHARLESFAAPVGAR